MTRPRALMWIVFALLLTSVLAATAMARNPIRRSFYSRYPGAEGTQLDKLLGAIEDEVQNRWAETPTPALTRARHRRALEDCVAALRRSGEAGLAELAAEDARLAARALGRITGSVDVEEILDVVFRDFCIGK